MLSCIPGLFPLKDWCNIDPLALTAREELKHHHLWALWTFTTLHPAAPRRHSRILEPLRPASFRIFHSNFYWRTVALQCCVGFSPSTVSQPHGYMHPSLWDFVPFGRHSALSRVPGPCSMFSLVVHSTLIHTINSLSVPIPISQFLPPPPSSLDIHTFVLYICVSIPAVQIGLSIPFF